MPIIIPILPKLSNGIHTVYMSAAVDVSVILSFNTEMSLCENI